MNDLAFMRVLHGIADFSKELQTIAQRQVAAITPTVDARAFHIIHHQIGKAVAGGGAIQKTDDVGVVQVRENLPLVAEPAQDVGGLEVRVHHFDGDRLAVLPVRALRQVDGSHPSAADHSNELVRPDHPAGQGFRAIARFIGGFGGLRVRQYIRLLQEIACAPVFGEQALQFASDRLVLFRDVLNERRPIGTFPLQGFAEECLEPLPTVRVHRCTA